MSKLHEAFYEALLPPSLNYPSGFIFPSFVLTRLARWVNLLLLGGGEELQKQLRKDT